MSLNDSSGGRSHRAHQKPRPVTRVTPPKCHRRRAAPVDQRQVALRPAQIVFSGGRLATLADRLATSAGASGNFCGAGSAGATRRELDRRGGPEATPHPREIPRPRPRSRPAPSPSPPPPVSPTDLPRGVAQASSRSRISMNGASDPGAAWRCLYCVTGAAALRRESRPGHASGWTAQSTGERAGEGERGRRRSC